MKRLYLIFFILFIGCGSSSGGNSSDKNIKIQINITPGITWQWQLSGKINTSYDAKVYDIDLFDANESVIDKLHSQNKIVICYFSAGSYEDWRSDKERFPSEVLGKELDGWAGERWLDISKINLLAPIMKARLDLARKKGCDGVEPDNVDGYVNDTGFNLTYEDQLNYNKFIANEAHKRGLLVGLKNDLDQVKDLVDFFDFMVNEECNEFDECNKTLPFIKNNKAVLNAEYNLKYLDDDNMTILCNKSNELNLSTLILPLKLDDSFRYSCDSFIYQKSKSGFGDRYAYQFYNNIWVSSIDLMEGNINNSIADYNESAFNYLSKKLKKSRYLMYWITKGWKKNWFDLDKIQSAMDKGKIPVFLYWYFGDELMNGIDENDVSDYLADVDRLKSFLSNLNGEKIVILEPEFNKENILNNEAQRNLFINAISNAIDKLKNLRVKISLCMMDTGRRDENSVDTCGYSNCALGDKSEWSRADSIYNSLLSKLDFISFQEMVAQFSRDPSNPGTWDNPNPISYNDSEIGINYLSKRVENLAKFLKERYNKPVMLAYSAIATATWSDNDSDGVIDNDEINTSGWVEKASNFYKDLNTTNLFGYAPMMLFDDPNHDKGGYQFFLQNEYHLGIISTDVNNSQINGNLKFKDSIIDYIFK